MPAVENHICPHCSAELSPSDKVCWLCRAPLVRVAAGAAGEAPFDPDIIVTPAATARGGGFSLSTLMMFVTLACVVLGVNSLWRGVGVPLGILSLIVWARTAAKVKRQASEGIEMTPLQKVLAFLSSFIVVVGIIGLVIVAAVGALLLVCMATMGSGGFR